VTSPSEGVRLDSSLRRGFDVILSVLGLVLLSPLLLTLGFLVRWSSPGPAIYWQERVGRGGELFQILKFRTMAVDADLAGPPVSGESDPRVTAVGRWLRAHRLDELPQLVNVTRGDLTIFGPRPEVAHYVEHYTDEERELLRVRPGVLGPGAILFAKSHAAELDSVSDPDTYYIHHQLHDKLALDLEYLRDRSLGRELAILTRTLGVVVPALERHRLRQGGPRS